MDTNTYHRLRSLAAVFIGLTVSLSVVLNNIILTIAAITTGMVFMFIIKSKVKGILVDERVQAVGDKAARMAFNIITIVLGISSLVLIFFSRISAPYLEGLGYILSYLALFSLMVYSLAFYYFNRKYGAGDEQ